MRYELISADCHVDLIWLPPDPFTSGASAALRDRMPHVIDGPKGPVWVTEKGAPLGRVNGMGSAGKRGIRRLTEPALRLRDQDRDGVQAEVLYGFAAFAERGA